MDYSFLHPYVNVIDSKWVFRLKYNFDYTIFGGILDVIIYFPTNQIYFRVSI